MSLLLLLSVCESTIIMGLPLFLFLKQEKENRSIYFAFSKSNSLADQIQKKVNMSERSDGKDVYVKETTGIGNRDEMRHSPFCHMCY